MSLMSGSRVAWDAATLGKSARSRWRVVALQLQNGGRMKLTSSVALLALFAGCGGDGDSCGVQSLQLEVTPAQACLQLSVLEDSEPDSYKIVGTNACTEPLVVHYPGTHDGGVNDTFAAGAEVLIHFDDSEVFNQGSATKTWMRNAVLGADTILMITLTKAPCD